MPGYHGVKPMHGDVLHRIMHPDNLHRMHGEGVHHRMHGGPAPSGHPMFDALKARHAHDRAEYIRMLNRSRRRGQGESLYPSFDSLRLLGADNDTSYLDRFMAEGGTAERRPRSNSHAAKGAKRNSANVDDIKKTLLGSLRSVASDENMYESLEVIQYRKTIEAISRNNKTRAVTKTGHPLFDHLRVENVLRGRRRHDASHSSSSGEDDLEVARKPSNPRFSRQELIKGAGGARAKDKGRHAPRHVIEEGSESEDEWAIPRPKLTSGGRTRRTGAAAASPQHDESDSSSKSTGLR